MHDRQGQQPFFVLPDLSGIDYVFTTVPLHTAVGVPIYEIGNFLDDADIPQVRKKLEQGSTDFLRS